MFYRSIISPDKTLPKFFFVGTPAPFSRVSPEYARRWIRPNPRFTLYRVVNRAGHWLACSEEESLSAKQVKFNKKAFHGLWNEGLIIINDYQLTGHKPLVNWSSTEENWRTMSPRHTWKERGGLEFFKFSFSSLFHLPSSSYVEAREKEGLARRFLPAWYTRRALPYQIIPNHTLQYQIIP